jgi:hypothetical protein
VLNIEVETLNSLCYVGRPNYIHKARRLGMLLRYARNEQVNLILEDICLV